MASFADEAFDSWNAMDEDAPIEGASRLVCECTCSNPEEVADIEAAIEPRPITTRIRATPKPSHHHNYHGSHRC
jgi:hypothetical protein